MKTIHYTCDGCGGEVPVASESQEGGIHIPRITLISGMSGEWPVLWSGLHFCALPCVKLWNPAPDKTASITDLMSTPSIWDVKLR